jgi:hypothetical protein
VEADMMRILAVAGLASAVLAGAAFAGTFEPTPCGDLVCHPPGKVEVRTARGTVEVARDGVPYLENGAVVLLPGDEFDVDLEFVPGEALARVSLPANGEGTPQRGLRLSFEQMRGKTDMTLKVQSTTDTAIKYTATMQLEDGRTVATSSCPVRAKMGAYELWPHPILRITLTNFRAIDVEKRGGCD